MWYYATTPEDVRKVRVAGLRVGARRRRRASGTVRSHRPGRLRLVRVLAVRTEE